MRDAVGAKKNREKRGWLTSYLRKKKTMMIFFIGDVRRRPVVRVFDFGFLMNEETAKSSGCRVMRLGTLSYLTTQDQARIKVLLLFRRSQAMAGCSGAHG